MTVNSEGLLAWTPQASQVGPQSVSVSVSDGQSGTDTQSWIVNVSNSTANRAPSITSIPDTVTNLEKVYRYQLGAEDPDGDYLLWSLDNAPKGMVIDAKTGSLSFQKADNLHLKHRRSGGNSYRLPQPQNPIRFRRQGAG
jgi:hypothetical protein